MTFGNYEVPSRELEGPHVELDRLFTVRRPGDEGPEPSIAARRLAAVASVVGFPLLFGLVDGFDLRPWIDAPVGFAVYGLVTVGVLLSWLGGLRVVNGFRRRLAQASDGDLDERERQVRDETHLMAYRLLMGLLTAGCIALAVSGLDVSRDALVAIAGSIVAGGWALPSAVLAWRDTDIADGQDRTSR
jgi:hypothetical protein